MFLVNNNASNMLKKIEANEASIKNIEYAHSSMESGMMVCRKIEDVAGVLQSGCRFVYHATTFSSCGKVEHVIITRKAINHRPPPFWRESTPIDKETYDHMVEYVISEDI